MSKKLTKFVVHNSAHFDDRNEHESETTVIQFSIAKTILQQALNLIQQQNARALSELLTGEFIYPGNGKVSDEDFSYRYLGDPYHSTYHGGHHVRNFTYEYYPARPVLEALFFEHNRLFRSLLSSVAQSENSNIHKAFIDSFRNTDIPLDILLPWDETQQNNIKLGIIEIEKYGRQLKNKKIERGDRAIELATELNKTLQLLPQEKESATASVKWLDYKFEFLKTLHSKDQFFIGHRGWKQVIANTASLIFSAAILNLLNYAITGNFLFFKQTTTQGLVTDLNKSLKPDLLQFSTIAPEDTEQPSTQATQKTFG